MFCCCYLLCPTLPLCSGEHSALRNIHLSCDFSQANPGGVSCLICCQTSVEIEQRIFLFITHFRAASHQSNARAPRLRGASACRACAKINDVVGTATCSLQLALKERMQRERRRSRCRRHVAQLRIGHRGAKICLGRPPSNFEGWIVWQGQV